MARTPVASCAAHCSASLVVHGRVHGVVHGGVHGVHGMHWVVHWDGAWRRVAQAKLDATCPGCNPTRPPCNLHGHMSTRLYEHMGT